MNEKFQQLLEQLRAITVAFVTNVVAKDEHVISFTSKSGETIWDDDPEFDAERARFTPDEWRKAEKSYSHYFGFAQFDMGPDLERGIYFQRDDGTGQVRFEFGANCGPHESICPPEPNTWIIGRRESSEKGFRLRNWSKVSKFEVSVQHALLTGTKVHPLTLREMEMSSSLADNCLANFARLVVNGDIEWYLAQRRSNAMSPAEEHTKRSAIDLTVRNLLCEFRPELWEDYKEQVSAEKLYSNHVPAPAPKPIRDNLKGDGVKVGLSTPFDSLDALVAS